MQISLLVVILVSFCFFTCTRKTKLVGTDKSEYNTGELIKVWYILPENADSSAWIGIISDTVAHGSEKTNDAYDIAYEYIGDKKNDTVEFYAPDLPGTYNIRLHNSDADGLESDYVIFTVK